MEAVSKYVISYEPGASRHYPLHLGDLPINVAEAREAGDKLHRDRYVDVSEDADDEQALGALGDASPHNPAYVAAAFHLGARTDR